MFSKHRIITSSWCSSVLFSAIYQCPISRPSQTQLPLDISRHGQLRAFFSHQHGPGTCTKAGRTGLHHPTSDIQLPRDDRLRSPCETRQDCPACSHDRICGCFRGPLQPRQALPAVFRDGPVRRNSELPDSYTPSHPVGACSPVGLHWGHRMTAHPGRRHVGTCQLTRHSLSFFSN